MVALTVLIEVSEEVLLALQPSLELLCLHEVQGPLLAAVDLAAFH